MEKPHTFINGIRIPNLAQSFISKSIANLLKHIKCLTKFVSILNVHGVSFTERIVIGFKHLASKNNGLLKELTLCCISIRTGRTKCYTCLKRHFGFFYPIFKSFFILSGSVDSLSNIFCKAAILLLRSIPCIWNKSLSLGFKSKAMLSLS